MSIFVNADTRLLVVYGYARLVGYDRNLDLDRTIWKNLTNWDPEEEQLYVDRLYYRHTSRKTTPQRLIVVVDQSGSMVDSMVNCTILASIFAGLPKVDVHLIAYDTQALDLTPWAHDPFETLLRTKLGGGTAKIPSMTVAAKTGTAQIPVAGGSSRKAYLPNFVGFAPVSNPRIVVAVMLDEPQKTGGYYGGRVAAPIFANVVASSLRRLGVQPDAPIDSLVAVGPGGERAR